MKRFVFFLFLPFACASQGVKLNQYDVFLKEQRVEMEPVTLLSSPSRLSLAFSSVATDCFVQMKGAGWGAVTIDEGDELRFLLSNDSTVIATSVALQTFEPGVPLSTYKQVYRLSEAGVQALARHEIAALRKFSFKESSDIRIPREAAAKLQKPAALFLAELQRTATSKRLKQIGSADVAEHIGDSVQFCSRVYNVASVSVEEGRRSLLQMQADFSEPIVNLILGGNDDKSGSAPETVFLNKDLCVSGVLTMRNGTPTIWVYTKEQVKTKPQTATQPTH